MRHQALLLAFALALAPALPAQKPAEKPAAGPVEKAAVATVPTQILTPLEAVARQLAKGAREREVKDLLAALDKLGFPKASHERLEKACKEDLAKAKLPIDSLPSGAKALRGAAKQIVALMEKLPEGDEKLDLARRILLLDGECAEAHAALGHKRVGKTWVAAELEEARARRGDILLKVAEASKLDVDMEEIEGVDDPIIQKACGVKATVVRRGTFEVRTNFSLQKSARILREVERAWALSWWLRKGVLELPPKPSGSFNRRVYVLVDSRELYNKYAAACIADGTMTADNAKHMGPTEYESGSFNLKTGEYVVLTQFEAPTQATLLVSMAAMKEGISSPLTAGHLNWLTLTCFGCLLPGYFYKEGGGKAGGGTTVETEEQRREREELQRMAKAGIAGSRTWMQYLAERREDPSFANSFVEAIGAISGNDLHKCTSVVEYLQELGLFADLYGKKVKKVGDVRTIEIYTDALGMPLGQFESNWRAWLLGARPGIAERIDKENLNAWPKDALSVLDYMNQIRDATFKDKRTRVEGYWKLKFDPELSEQCALHAHYLTLHPEQQKWPDAHEEYADKSGYTVEGAWAGLQSVIVWKEGGVLTFNEAVDVWMGSFYHRLPLIDPGVLRLGWGSEDIYAVMDMSSLATPYEKPYLVLYPYDGQKDVETKFVGNEHPDPIPNGPPGSVNEGELYGYPITIQTNPVDERGEVVDIDMKLYTGKDEEVECFFSSPAQPTNPELAPAGTWCLIPKAPLKPATEYRVVAQWKAAVNRSTTNVSKREEWKFKTK